MPRYVALLQGVNVGGTRTLPMADLRAVLADAGGEDVATYIQSGNAVFAHQFTDPERLRLDLQGRLAAHTGFEVAVVLRDAAQMAEVVASNPFPGAEPTTLLVGFLARPPAVGTLDTLDTGAVAPEEVVARGLDLYLHLPNGMGRAKLPAALARLGGGAEPPLPGTTRNWRTVTRLREMVEG